MLHGKRYARYGATVANVQINLRVPEEARSVLSRLTARLREDPAFLAALENLVGDPDPAGAGLPLADRVTAAEAALQDLAARLAALEQVGATGALPATVQEPAAPDSPVARFIDMKRADPPWTVEGGKGRSLTPIGEQRFGEMVSAGLTMANISDLTGLSLATVGRRKREIREAANG